MRKRYVLLVMTLLFGLALVGVDQYTRELNISNTQASDSEPDYYGEQLYSREYSEVGQLSQTLSALASQHFPLRQVTEFTAPVIESTDDSGDTWQVVAERGELIDRENVLQLRQQVEIRPLNQSDDRKNVVIQTEALDYYTEQQLARTDLPVVVTSPDTRITAVGMTIDLKRQRMEFLSEVQTFYVPAFE